MEIRFWGVRGSIATSGPATAEVGGNTSCVEVRCGDSVLILDAGTGLRALGVDLMRRGAGRGGVEAHLLLSHFHWDHIQGFPFFGPAYVPGNRVSIYGAPLGGKPVHEAFAAQMRPPHFPVDMSAMRAALDFRDVAPGEALPVGEARVRTAVGRHPDGCLVWRVEHGGAAVVYATDTEHDGDTGEIDGGLLDLARGADLLIYDAQYTADEYCSKRGWGHSTAEEGIRLAEAAGVRQLVLFHHDPGHDDAEVERIEAAARARFAGAIAAREGLELVLKPRVPGRLAA